MDINEEEVLISLRTMRNSDVDDPDHNGHSSPRPGPGPHHPGTKAYLLPWLDLRVFYVRVSKSELLNSDSTPEYLTLNHVPLNRDALLEVNCVRTGIHSDGVSTLLKRDRLDRRSEEVTFVNTDSIRMAGPTKFEVFHDGVLVLSGTLELAGPSWSMVVCDSGMCGNDGFVKGSQNGVDPGIEVYVAGSFSGSPIVLTRNLQLSSRRRQGRRKTLESIPEYEATESGKDDSKLAIATQSRDYTEYIKEEEGHCSTYWGPDDLDGELSWFNAGVRVGVGISLGVCLGVGIGVGLLVRTYHGTAGSFRRRLF